MWHQPQSYVWKGQRSIACCCTICVIFVWRVKVSFRPRGRRVGHRLSILDAWRSIAYQRFLQENSSTETYVVSSWKSRASWSDCSNCSKCTKCSKCSRCECSCAQDARWEATTSLGTSCCNGAAGAETCGWRTGSAIYSSRGAPSSSNFQHQTHAEENWKTWRDGATVPISWWDPRCGRCGTTSKTTSTCWSWSWQAAATTHCWAENIQAKQITRDRDCGRGSVTRRGDVWCCTSMSILSRLSVHF